MSRWIDNKRISACARDHGTYWERVPAEKVPKESRASEILYISSVVPLYDVVKPKFIFPEHLSLRVLHEPLPQHSEEAPETAPAEVTSVPQPNPSASKNTATELLPS